MLEKPDLPDEKIAACLQDQYGLDVNLVAFLPLGADLDAAVYRVLAKDKTPYFLKLKRGAFEEISVDLPKFLYELGIDKIIPPLASKTGQLWTNLDSYKAILYPYIEGKDAYEIELSDHQWREFGTALKKVHTVILPSALAGRIPRETYSSSWREMAKSYLEHAEHGSFDDPVAAELAAFMKSKRLVVLDLVERAERLAHKLQVEIQKFIMCHSDLHAGNLLITREGAFYIVDWDNPILAPKERDLMFVGGAQGFIGHTPQEEENLFYQGYGPAEVDPVALAYYRYERIVEDIAAYCDQIFSTSEGDADRAQGLHYLKSNFLPGNTIEVAVRKESA
jgi:spectinomycin phosphotransferase